MTDLEQKAKEYAERYDCLPTTYIVSYDSYIAGYKANERSIGGLILYSLGLVAVGLIIGIIIQWA